MLNQKIMNNSDHVSKEALLSMLKKSQTKVIFPIITYGLLKEFVKTGKTEFVDAEVRKAYHSATAIIQKYLGHTLHTGGKYYDAYPIRNLPRYGVLAVRGKTFELTELFRDNALILIDWLPEIIKQHIDSKIGVIPTLGSDESRLAFASEMRCFADFIKYNIELNPTNFEIFSFAIIKCHLEKFACKIYRDTKTSAHDKGVDLSTNFGVVYQIKKLRLMTVRAAEEVYAEIKMNFDSERMSDGRVVLIVDEISKDVKNYLIKMKIQLISKIEILSICEQFREVEERMKVLGVIYDEFRREYGSQI